MKRARAISGGAWREAAGGGGVLSPGGEGGVGRRGIRGVQESGRGEPRQDSFLGDSFRRRALSLRAPFFEALGGTPERRQSVPLEVVSAAVSVPVVPPPLPSGRHILRGEREERGHLAQVSPPSRQTAPRSPASGRGLRVQRRFPNFTTRRSLAAAAPVRATPVDPVKDQVRPPSRARSVRHAGPPQPPAARWQRRERRPRLSAAEKHCPPPHGVRIAASRCPVCAQPWRLRDFRS